MKAQEQIEKLRTIQESMHEIADKVVSLGDGSVMLNDVAEGKKRIAEAINSRGGVADASESFEDLADDITQIPSTGIFSNGVEQDNTFSFLKYVTSSPNNEIVSINDSTITEITRSYAFNGNIALREVIMPNLVTISGGNVFQSCHSLQWVQLPNLVTISGGQTFYNCSSLQSVQLHNLAVISGAYTFSNCPSLQNVQLHNLAVISVAATFDKCSSLQSVQFGSLAVCVDPFMNSKPKLRNITIQDADINLPFQNWTATSVINEGQSGIDELNNNLRTNLLEKLADHSTDGQTRTLRLGWLAYVTQENIDYANSKGWTLTT